MTNVPNDPDANPTYGESKAINEEITGPGTSGGTGTDAMTDPGAVVLSQGLADQIAVDPGTVVPNGTKITPSTTPNSGGVTTIEYPATPNSVASKVTVVPYTRDSNGNITNADKAGIVMPTVVPVGFTASDNPVSDVQSLLDNHATLQQIQAYMALNNVSWGQLSGPQQSTLGKMGYSTSNSGDSYEFDSPDKSIGTVYVPTKEWDSWTPAQQLAFQIKLKLTPPDARLVINKDGSWGYTSKSEAATQQANSGYTNGIPTDLYNTYLQNKDAYAAAGKPPPLNFDHTVDGQVTVTPYADPSKAVTYTVPTGTELFFNNVKGMPVIDRVTDLKGNTIIKANSDGTFSSDDINAAVASGKLTQSDVDTIFGKQATTTTGSSGIVIGTGPATTTGSSGIVIGTGPAAPGEITWNDFKNDPSNKIPPNATFVSYDQKTGTVNYNVPLIIVPSGPAAPGEITWSDFKADPANKIPASAVFTSFDSKTGTVNFTVLPTSPSTPLTPAQLAARNAALSAFEHATLAPPVAQVTSVKATKTGINLSIVNPAGKALATNIWNDIVSYGKSHSGITVPAGTKPETFAQEGAALKAAALKMASQAESLAKTFKVSNAVGNIKNASQDVVVAVDKYGKSHSGITVPAGTKPETLQQEGKAIETAAVNVSNAVETEFKTMKSSNAVANLKNAGEDLVAAAKSFNATHSGIAKVVTVNGKQTVVRTAPEAGLPTIGGSLGEQLTTEGEIEASSGGSLTPVVLAAALVAIGAAVTPTVKAAIEQEIAHYKTTHAGQAPTASQVTLTDSNGNIATLAEVANVARSMSAPPKQFQESIPLNSGLKPIPESIPADSGIKPFQESMPSQTLNVPQEGADLIKNPIQDTEKFPIGVQAPPNGAVNEKPSTPAEPPKTEEGKQIQAQQAAKQAIPIPLTEEEWNKVIQDVKTAPDADLNPKTVEGKKLLAKELADKQARQAEVAQLATDAKTFNEIMAKNEELLINMKTAESEWETHTEAGKAIRSKVKADEIEVMNSLKDTAIQLEKTQSAIRDMERAVASADWEAHTYEGDKIKATYKAAQAAKVTAMRDAAAQLEKTKAAIRDMERAVASADFKAYTADGIKIKTDIQAARAAEIKQLKDSAATVANFEEIIQRIQAEQGTVNFKTMSEIINKNRENEIKMYKQNIDQADGGSWLIHGDDGSILFSVLEEADTTTATDVQRTAALEQLKKLYDARQINYQEYRHGYLHWSGKSGTADKEQTEIENFNNEVTARSMRRAANPASVSGKNIAELDQKVSEAYTKGELTQSQLADYMAARNAYVIEKNGVGTYSTSPKVSRNKNVNAMALTIGIAAGVAAQQRGATKVQTAQAINQAVVSSQLVETQPAIQQITQTAQQIATQQAVKSGLQVQTQQAIKEATKTQTIEQSKTAEQEQTQEQVQTQEQTQTKATTQEATQESTKENEKENEKEKEEELEDEDELTKPPLPKPNITKDAEGFVHVPQGSATWKQGFGYRTLVPPYDQKHFIFTMKPPKGAVVVPNAKSAKDTIQKLGKGNLPEDMNVKMGIMTVDVKDPPNKPQKHSGSIAFKRIPITNNTASRSAPPHPARFGTGITRRRDR